MTDSTSEWYNACADVARIMQDEKRRHKSPKYILRKIDKFLTGVFLKAAQATMDEVEKPPMTQEEVENWILVKGQRGERWFEIRVLDKEIDQDPTMRALMVALSDMIQKGVMNMPFIEAQHAAEKEGKPDLQIVDTGGRSVKGD